jgi:hypothetical protein
VHVRWVRALNVVATPAAYVDIDRVGADGDCVIEEHAIADASAR